MSVGASLTLGACVSSEVQLGGEEQEVEEVDFVPGEISYYSDWDAEGIEIDGEGSWRTVNDLGYEVRVDEGYLVSLSAQISLCDDQEGASVVSSMWRWVLSEAYAADGGDNPTETDRGLVESLTNWQEGELGYVRAPAGYYCSAHYLVARADHLTQAMPERPEMLGLSLHISGAYRSGDAGRWEPFVIQTSLANGKVMEFPSPFDAGEGDLEVRVTRRPAEFFDGVDFAAADADELAFSTVVAIIHATVIEAYLEGQPRP